MSAPSQAFRIMQSNARLAWLNLGGAPAYMLVYGNTRPDIAGAAAGASPLFRVDFATPAGTVDADGKLTFNLGTPNNALATGTANWARLFNGADEAGLDMDVSTMSGTAEVRLSRRDISIGAPVRVVIAAMS